MSMSTHEKQKLTIKGLEEDVARLTATNERLTNQKQEIIDNYENTIKDLYEKLANYDTQMREETHAKNEAMDLANDLLKIDRINNEAKNILTDRVRRVLDNEYYRARRVRD